MNDTLFAYVPFFLFLAFSLGLAGGMVALSAFFGRRRQGQPVVDLSTYECGIPAGEPRKQRLTVKFYLVAMLFILFDIEVVFMYPWAVSFSDTVVPGRVAPLPELLLWEALAFAVILFLGWVYVVKKGVLEWHRER